MPKNENDIGGKVGLDVTDFKAGVAELRRSTRVIRSSFQAAAAGMDDWRDSAEGLETKIKSLDGETKNQRKIIEALGKEYKKIADQKGKTSAAAQNLEVRINKEKAALARNEKELKKCKIALKEFEAGTHKSSEAAKKFEVQIEKLCTASTKLNKVGTAMNRYVTLPLLAMGGASVKLAMDLEATEAKYSTVFGTMRNEMQEYIDDWQQLVAVSEVGARNIASGIQDLYVPMGIAREEAQGMTEQTMTLIGALANFNSAKYSAEDVSTAFTSAITGEFQALKGLGIQIDAATVKQKAYEMGLSTSAKEASKSAQAQAVLALAYEQSKDALAVFNEESLDQKTKLNIALAQLKDIGAELGTELMPMVIEGTKALTKLVKQFNDLSPSGKKAIVTMGGIAAGIGPITKGTAKTIDGVVNMKKAWKKFKAVRVAGEIGSIGKVAGSAATGLGAMGTTLGTVVPVVGIAAAAIGGTVLAIKWMNDSVEESRRKFVEATVAAHVFGEEIEDTEPIEKFDKEVKEVTKSVNKLNKTADDIEKKIEFKVDSSAFDEAKQVVIDLREEYALLLLAMDDGAGSTDTVNGKFVELGETLKNTKEATIALQIAEIQDSDYTPEKRAGMIRELNTELDNYCTLVDDTMTSITGLNDVTYVGTEITGDMVTAFDDAKGKLMELGATEEQVAGATLTLKERNKLLNDGIAANTTQCDGFLVTLSSYAELLGDKLTPVYQAVTGAADEYSEAVGAAREEHMPKIDELNGQIAKCEEGAAMWEHIQEVYAENPEAFVQYLWVACEGLIETTDEINASYDLMVGTLSEAEREALSQLNSAHEAVGVMDDMTEGFKATGEELKGKLSVEEGIFSQKEADAFAKATGTVKTALTDFSLENGIPVEDAINGLRTSINETGLELGENTDAMLTSLSIFGTELVTEGGTIGQDAFDEMIAPFKDAEQSGKDLIDDMVDGVVTQTDERIGDVTKAGEKMSLEVYKGAAKEAEIQSPSKKMKKIGGFMVDGLVQGLDENAHKAYAAAGVIAKETKRIVGDEWGVKSPAKEAIKLSGFFVKGLEVGFLDNIKATTNVIGQSLRAETAKMQTMGMEGLGQSINHYHHERKQTFKTDIHVAQGQEPFDWRRKSRQLVRDIAAQVAQG